MRTPWKILSAAAVLLLAVAALLWWLPAIWALPLASSSLHGLRLEQVGGTVWDGHAGRVLATDGRDLGQLNWQLSRRALLGHLSLQIDLAGPSLQWSGHLQRESGNRALWSHLDARVDLTTLGDPRLRAVPGRPQGEVTVHVQRALLEAGWPIELQGHWQWQQAELQAHTGAVSLGGLQGDLSSHNGVLHLPWRDDGHGPLRTQGTLQLSPLGWRLDATLQAASDAPALQRWLATLGKPDAAGVIHVERRGGLAAALPKEKTAR